MQSCAMDAGEGHKSAWIMLNAPRRWKNLLGVPNPKTTTCITSDANAVYAKTP